MSGQWRAAAAGDADRAATTQETFIDQTRRAGSRDCIAILRGADRFEHFPAAERRKVIAGVLATSIEKQARAAGLGRVHIPVGGAA